MGYLDLFAGSGMVDTWYQIQSIVFKPVKGFQLKAWMDSVIAKIDTAYSRNLLIITPEVKMLQPWNLKRLPVNLVPER